MEFILGLFICLLGVAVVYVFIDWMAHLGMTNDECDAVGWAGYKKFKKEFKKVEWVRKYHFKHSVFSKEIVSGSEFHANVVKFNDNGMLIYDPISYLLVKIYVYRFISKNYGKKIIKW